jgi:DNA-binding NarL/FixJ family response regulator
MDILDVLDNYFVYKEQDLDTDEYQSALDIDLAIGKLLRENTITKEESQAFYFLLSGYSFRKIAAMLNLNRKSISKRVREIIELVKELYNA